MGLTLEQYEAMPVLAVDWDLAMARIEEDLEAEAKKREAGR